MIITVKVKPGSKSKPRVEQNDDGSYVVYIHERAKDGEANAAMIRLLSKHFGVAKTTIKIKSGDFSRVKRVEI